MIDADATRAREMRARRAAQRQDLILRKSPRRDPRAVDYGLWWLEKITRYGGQENRRPVTKMVSLDEIERYLDGEATS
jgi:hypothetical protein